MPVSSVEFMFSLYMEIRQGKWGTFTRNMECRKEIYFYADQSRQIFFTFFQDSGVSCNEPKTFQRSDFRGILILAKVRRQKRRETVAVIGLQIKTYSLPRNSISVYFRRKAARKQPTLQHFGYFWCCCKKKTNQRLELP